MGTAVDASSVVVVPRERFGSAVESLTSVLSTMAPGTRLIYVDGGSPRGIAREIAQAAIDHDFLLLRSERYLAPNEARNLALPFITTELVAFIDNDVLMERGWLEGLSACARETGAWLVTPIIVQKGPTGTIAHMVGGDCRIVDVHGRSTFHEAHRWNGRPFEDLPPLTREPTEFIEFHCVLVALPALNACFPLDEQLRSSREHCDLSLQVRALGGEIWLEPSVTVAQLAVPKRLPIRDRHYYALRWSNEWNRATLQRFREKWDLDPTDPAESKHLDWLTSHRRWGNRGYGSPVGALPRRRWRFPTHLCDLGVQTVVGRGTHTRRPVPPAQVVHAPAWSQVGEQPFRG